MKNFITISYFFLGFIALNAQTSLVKTKQDLLKKYHFQPESKANAIDRGDVVCHPDSSISYLLNENGVDSTVSGKSYFQYNTNGDLLKQTNYELNNDDVLVVTTKNIFTYNAQNVLINEEGYTLNSSDELTLNNVTKYFPKGTSTTLLDSTVTWTTSFGILDRNSKEEPTYNAMGNITQQITYNWTQTGWEFSMKIEYEYSPTTGKPLSTTNYEWNGLDWTPLSMANYEYDALDSLTQILTTDLMTNQPSDRLLFVYNTAQNSQTLTLDLWDGAAWVLLFYNFVDLSATNQVEQVDQFIDFPGFFTFGTRLINIFPAGSDCLGFSNVYLTEDNETWVYAGRTFYYYNGSVIPTNSLINNKLELTTTPNPFSDNLIVTTEISSDIKVYNTTGMLLLESKSANETTVLSTEQLPIGAYFIVVSKNGKSERKLVAK
jgi:Secretion system C-terminal sorting domain